MVYAIMGIGVLGFVVWGHHMFMSGMSPYSAFAFSLLTMAIGVPSAIKTFNWLGTLWRGRIRFKSPMLFAIGFVSLFVSGGLSGPFLAQPAIDIQLHDTYFVVAHFHYVMVGGMVLSYLAGIHYWWPKITGKMYTEWIAVFAAFTTFVGFNLTFFPQFLLGYLGMPRRYHAYPPEFQVLHVLSTAGASVLALGLALPVFYLLWSLWFGKDAGDNPWGGTTLEWETPSPPPTENFYKTPVVTREAYQYYTEKEPEIVG
jgi:cytochrome c oxidase subunit 1